MSQQQTPSNEDLRRAGFSQAQIEAMSQQQQQQQYNDLMQNWHSSKRGKQNDTSVPT